jgi:hypothetical protein
MSETKTYDLGTVLTVITGRLLTGMDNLYDILNFMTGDELFTHQLPRACEVCMPGLVEQFPDLASVQVPEFTGDGKTAVQNFVQELGGIYGDSFQVAPVAGWEHKNPLTELAEMMPDKPIIAVVAEPQ